MTAPAPLQSGDLVAITCLARRMTAKELAPAVTLFESWGLRVRLGASVGAIDRQFGGTDALRANDLQTQWKDPEVRAIFSARGGYGCARLLPLLDPAVFRGEPTWLVGFSDVTALHAWVGQQTDLVTLHGPMPSTFTQTDAGALESLRQVLFGRLPAINASAHPGNRLGEVSGRVIGGNLSVLYSLRGTPWFPDTQGAILFLEDLDEYRYHVDRMLQNASLGGVWDDLAGLVVGGMTDMRDNTVPFGLEAEDMLAEHTARFDFPVAMGFPAGHIPHNMPLLLGHRATLKVQAQGASLVY